MGTKAVTAVVLVLGGLVAVAVLPSRTRPRVADAGGTDSFGPRMPRNLKEPPAQSCCYYQLTDSDRARLVTKVNGLGLGMSRRAVIDALGPAAFELPITVKGFLSV